MSPLSEGQSSVHASIHDNTPTRRTELIAVQVSMTAVALLLVALRLISRYMIIKSPGWDDYAIIVAMVGPLSTLSRTWYLAFSSSHAIQILAIIQAPLVLSCLPHGAEVDYWIYQPSSEALYTMKVHALFTIVA